MRYSKNKYNMVYFEKKKKTPGPSVLDARDYFPTSPKHIRINENKS